MSEEQFGIRHVIGVPIATTRLSEQNIVAMPPRSTKFTLEEWKLNNDSRCRHNEDQRQLADWVLADCDRVRAETEERATLMQSTTERRLEERIHDVNFNKTELEIQRKEICLEMEALGVYKVRLQDFISNLECNALNIIRKCLMLRDGRLGIDLVLDGVEIALQREIEVIIGAQGLIKKVLEQLHEQTRRLRSMRYMLDRDLQYKQGAIEIDKSNLDLKHSDLCLSMYEGYANLDPANISVNEYDALSAKNIRNAAREVASARPIRVYVDSLLRQVTEDLINAYNKTNKEFSERIKEARRVKEHLEDVHRETTKKICDMQNNIVSLQKALADKEGHAGLAHTRLGRRAQRIGCELVKDSVGQSLMAECHLIRMSVEQLQQALMDATASLRYLCQTQIQLEEDINIKMNTLKIDEVDCMTLRQTIQYNFY